MISWHFSEYTEPDSYLLSSIFCVIKINTYEVIHCEISSNLDRIKKYICSITAQVQI